MNALVALSRGYFETASLARTSQGLMIRAIVEALCESGYSVEFRDRTEFAFCADPDLLVAYPEELGEWCRLVPAKATRICLSCTAYCRVYAAIREREMAASGGRDFDQLPRDPEEYDGGYRLADAVIVQGNEYVMASYAEAPIAVDRYAWVPVPTDPDFFAPDMVGHEGFIVLCLQRELSARKGFHRTLAAWALWDDQSARLRCVGAMNRADDWPEISDESAAEWRIDMMGWVTDAEQLRATICGADVLLNLSPTEGGEPGVTLEAAACGISIISSRSAALDEAGTGWIVDETDAAGVVAALAGAKEDIENRHCYGMAARRHVCREHTPARCRDAVRRAVDRGCRHRNGRL